MRRAKRIWDQLENHLPKIIQTSLLPPAKESEIEYAENILGVSFPEELRCSLLIHNGQEAHPAETNLGVIFGFKLLSVQEMLTEEPLLKTQVAIPVTSTLGFSKQWCVNPAGEVFLQSGWNVFKKADNWLDFLSQLLA